MPHNLARPAAPKEREHILGGGLAPWFPVQLRKARKKTIVTFGILRILWRTSHRKQPLSGTLRQATAQRSNHASTEPPHAHTSRFGSGVPVCKPAGAVLVANPVIKSAKITTFALNYLRLYRPESAKVT